MHLALVVVLALDLAVSTGALVVGLILLRRKPAPSTEVHNYTAADAEARRRHGADRPVPRGGYASGGPVVGELPRVQPGPAPGGARPTVQSRADDETPTQTYGAVRPTDHP